MKFYTAYDPPPEVGVDCSVEPDLTKQEFKDECDINVIMARYIRTGVLPPGIGVGMYGDFSDIGSYQEALQIIERASEQFAAQPSGVRDRFNHSPEAFLEFVMNPDNRAEAQKLGLLKDEKPADPVVVAGVPQTGEPKKVV